MSRNTVIKVLAASVGVLLVGVAVAFVYILGSLNSALSEWSPAPNEYTIRFKDVDETVYVRARTWGLAGNHQEIILANSPIVNEDLAYDKDRQLVYLDNSEIFYKMISSDTLEIRAGMLTVIPKNFSQKVRIRQVKLNHEEEQRLSEDYADYGFTKVTVYPSK